PELRRLRREGWQRAQPRRAAGRADGGAAEVGLAGPAGAGGGTLAGLAGHAPAAALRRGLLRRRSGPPHVLAGVRRHGRRRGRPADAAVAGTAAAARGAIGHRTRAPAALG